MLAEKLLELRIVERQLEKRIKEGGQALKGIVEKNSSFIVVMKGCTGRSENEIWVEAGENETKREVGNLKKYMVGSRASIPNPIPSEKEVRTWSLKAWRLEGDLKVVLLGKNSMLFNLRARRKRIV